MTAGDLPDVLVVGAGIGGLALALELHAAGRTGVRATGFTQDDACATVHAVQTVDGSPVPPIRARALVGCDGIKSVVRRQLHPDEGAPRYSGITMWRGTTVSPPILGGAAMIRAGWLATGKMVIYPIRDAIDADGSQLVNWVAELETVQRTTRGWTTEGSLVDFAAAFEDWTFPWLDVPDMLARADSVLEYPMVDQDPLGTTCGAKWCLTEWVPAPLGVGSANIVAGRDHSQCGRLTW